MAPLDADPLPPFDPKLLAAYPEEVGHAAAAFASSRKQADLRTTLHGLLRMHQVQTAEGTPVLDPATATPDVPLLGGLGLDSLALAELTFLLEDLWSVQFTNEELTELDSLGDLESALAQRLRATT